MILGFVSALKGIFNEPKQIIIIIHLTSLRSISVRLAFSHAAIETTDSSPSCAGLHNHRDGIVTAWLCIVDRLAASLQFVSSLTLNIIVHWLWATIAVIAQRGYLLVPYYVGYLHCTRGGDHGVASRLRLSAPGRRYLYRYVGTDVPVRYAPSSSHNLSAQLYWLGGHS
jgi:hypothetical protein